jgi:Putative prokaryotic signal transducing protein
VGGRSMMVWRSEGWVQVAEAATAWNAELIAGRLRAAGIEAAVMDQTFRQEPLPSVRSFAIARVVVPEADEEKARQELARPAAEAPEDETEPSGEQGEKEQS